MLKFSNKLTRYSLIVLQQQLICEKTTTKRANSSDPHKKDRPIAAPLENAARQAALMNRKNLSQPARTEQQKFRCLNLNPERVWT